MRYVVEWLAVGAVGILGDLKRRQLEGEGFSRCAYFAVVFEFISGVVGDLRRRAVRRNRVSGNLLIIGSRRSSRLFGIRLIGGIGPRE